MTAVILDFRSKQLENYAKKFCDIYELEGDESAGGYLLGLVEPTEYPTMRGLIREQFIKRGYTFRDEG